MYPLARIIKEKMVDKYDFFAEFINRYISKDEMRFLNEEFKKQEYIDDPQKILDKLESEGLGKWSTHADKKPRMGNADVQAANFGKFWKNKIVSRDKLVFNDPYKVEKSSIDFSPLFKQYKELTGEFIETPDVSRRVKATARIVKPEFEPGAMVPKVLPHVFDNRVGGDIERAKEQIKEAKIAGNMENVMRATNNLVVLRNAMYDLAFHKQEHKPMKSSTALKRYEEINKLLKPYYSSGERIGMKTDSYLLSVLEFKGMDVSGLKSTEDVRSAAKSAGLDLRRYQQSREELIHDLEQVTPYSRKDLEKRPQTYLSKLWKTTNKSYVAPKKRFVYTYDDLVGTNEATTQLYEEQKVELTKKDRMDTRKYVKSIYPFFTENELNKEVNQVLAAKVLRDDVMIPKTEIERRYMEWKYQDSDKRPSFEDLQKLSEVTFTQFKLKIATREVEREDPITGKMRTVKDTIPRDSFRSYRKELSGRITRAEKIKTLPLESEENTEVEEERAE